MTADQRLTLDQCVPAMTAPPPDALVEAVARAIYDADHKGMRNVWAWDNCGLDMEHPGRRGKYYHTATAALAICRAHFAGLARAHGAAIRARIDIGDSDATAARFEQRALVAHEVAEIIEGRE